MKKVKLEEASIQIFYPSPTLPCIVKIFVKRMGDSSPLPPFMIRRTNSRNNVGNNDFDAMINYEFNFDEHLSYNLLRTYVGELHQLILKFFCMNVNGIG